MRNRQLAKIKKNLDKTLLVDHLAINFKSVFKTEQAKTSN